MKDSNPLPHSLEQRNSRLEQIKNKEFDLLIIGAGVHGALTAWIAAKLGYSILLIDAADYGQGTSSRSSKLLHGGVRYLEQGHLSLVYKSLIERRAFLKMAPHLTRALPFLFSVKKGQTAPAFLVRIGLFIYEKVSNLVGAELDPIIEKFLIFLTQIGFDSSKLIKYHDGQVNDVRFCIEAVCEAAKLGAKTFNYLSFSGAKLQGEMWLADIRDNVSNQQIQVRAKKIANLSGAALLKVHQACGLEWQINWPNLTYSTGVHLYFDKPWYQAGLILPAETKGRYYFVLPAFTPYRKGVLVGTTDCKTEQADCYPEPSELEIEQILNLLNRDLPEAGLNRSSMFHATSGTRVLAGSQSESHKLNRDEQILMQDSYATILGGKYTTARSTAVKLLEKLFGTKLPEVDLILSGSKNFSPSSKTSAGEDLEQLEKSAAISRFGVAANEMLSSSNNLNQLVQLQIKYCIEKEQAVYWQDVVSRRLNLDCLPKDSEILKYYISNAPK